MYRVISLISHVPNPRANRRLCQFRNLADEVTLIFWNKGGESCDLKRLDGINQIEIAEKANRVNALKRIIPTLKFKKKAISIMNYIKPNVIYAERFDMLFIAWLYWRTCKVKPKLIFEVPDLPHLMVDNLKSLKEFIVKSIISKLEKMIYSKVDLLIVTSEKFYDNYYFRYIAKEKVQYMPNIPDLSAFASYKKKDSGKFTVGFIGVVRYPEQLNMLLTASTMAGINVLLAGFTESCDDIQKRCEQMENVKYLGKYNYDRDIASLYASCDCIYSVYDTRMTNVNIALPNKLYEALYCRLPIIVAEGTYLGEIVEHFGLGCTVKADDTDMLANLLMRLKTDSVFYNNIIYNCEKYQELLDSDRYAELFRQKFIKLQTPKISKQNI